MPLSALPRSNARRTKPVIGLAGGIGAGKSSVAREFERIGASVLDFDRLAHEELAAPDVRAALLAWWGQAVIGPDGAIDRRRLGAIVFSDPAELARLEGLLYPRLTKRSAETVARLQDDPRVTAVVLDAPKLFEAGLNQQCDAIVFVEADRACRLERVTASRGWDDSELARRENLQIPLDIKRASADYVVISHDGIEHLRSQVEQVFKSVLSSFT